MSERTGTRKILHLLPDFALGGGQRLLLRNVEAATPGRHQHHVVSVWRDGAASIRSEYEAVFESVASLELRRSRLPQVVRGLSRKIRDTGIDLIHCNNTPWDLRLGQIASRLCGVPLVNTFHSMLFEHAMDFSTRLERRVFSGTLRAATAVTRAVADAWAPCIREMGLDPAAVEVHAPGVGPAFTTPCPSESRTRLRAELGLGDASPVLAFVARLVAGKGCEHLAPVLSAVLQRYPGTVLLVAGDGPERGTLEAALREAGCTDRARMLGQRDDVAALLPLADLLLFPSRGEGFGLSVLEAMAVGTPVVAFDLPALQDFFEDGRFGRLVAPHSSDAFCAATLALLDAPDELRAMGERARERVLERHTLEQSVGRLEAFYDAVFERFPVRR